MNTSTAGWRLLLVDDDDCIIRLVERIVQRSFPNEIQMETMTSPRDAMDRISQGGVDLLVTDLEMPEIKGIDLLRLAKQRDASTQVLLLTGASTHEALMAALESGASDYLLKPIDSEQLVLVIRQALERKHRWRLALAQTWREHQSARGAARAILDSEEPAAASSGVTDGV